MKAAEPDKIFATSFTDFSHHWQIYQSPSGHINRIAPANYPYEDTSIVLIEDNRRVLLYNWTTQTVELAMEQYYINHATIWIEHKVIDGT
jgi:hypothetical protein